MGKPPTLKITNILLKLRKDKGITQEEAAQAVGVTRVTMNYLEYGVYLPSLDLAFIIAKFFNLSIEEIFHVEGKNI